MKMKIKNLFFIAGIWLFLYLFFLLPFSLVYVAHSDAHQTILDFNEWLTALIVVLLGTFWWHIHYPLSLRHAWWGILIGAIPFVPLFIFFQMGDTAWSLQHTPDVWPLIWITVVNAIGVGVSEELIFRGTILTLFRRIFGSYRHAILLSVSLTAILFGAMHLEIGTNFFFPSLTTAINAAGSGFLFGILTICTKSLWPAIILHAAWDVLPMLQKVMNPGTWLADVSPQPFVLSGFLAGVAACVVMVLFGLLIYGVWRRFSHQVVTEKMG